MKFMRLFILTLACLQLASCALFAPKPAPKSPGIGEVISFGQLPDWSQDHHAEAWPALLSQCGRLSKQQNQWQKICAAANTLTAPTNAAAKVFFEQYFEPRAIYGKEGARKGLFTGYFEPLLFGHTEPTEKYRYPVYGLPDDLLIVDLAEIYPEFKGKRIRARLQGKRVIPYFSRREIDSPSAPLQGNELLWVDDKEVLFFLHIQGSGRVQMQDGRTLGLGYANQNGHRYFAIGKELINMGVLATGEVNMFSIRQWLQDNPTKADGVLHKNPSYVFFSVREEVDAGPIGSLNVPLTPERSVAIDRKIIPLGTPLWIQTTLPDGQAFTRLVFAQDTGGAINGPVRADVFFGTGQRAEFLAGNMKQAGTIHALLPKLPKLPKLQ